MSRSGAGPLDLAALRALLGPDLEVRSAEPLAGGLVNPVLRVETSAGSCVFRRWTRGRRVAAVCRAVGLAPPEGVPTPRWLRWGEDWALVEWVDGVQLVDVLGAMGPDEAFAVGRDAGRILAHVHRRELPRPGALDGELSVPRPFPSVYAAWDWAMQDLLDGDAGTRLDGLDVRGLWAAHRDRLRGLGPPFALCHGDYKPENLRVQGTRVVAVLDWEFAYSGPALCDLGQLLRSAHLMDPAWERGVEEGYRAAGGALPEDWRAVGRLLDLLNLVQFLKRPDRPTMNAELLERIRHTIDVLG